MPDRRSPLEISLRRVVVGWPFRAISRLRVEGRDNIPRTGAAIIAANHLSAADAVVVPVSAGRPISFLAKAEYFDRSSLKGRATAWFMDQVSTIPVERDKGRAAMASMDALAGALRDGRVIALHPEGTRSPDGRLYKGRTGAARLSLTTGAPIIPCGIIGTDALQPAGQRLPRPARVIIRYGAPISPEKYVTGPLAARARDLTRDVMAVIAALTGQEVVDTHSPGPRKN